MNKKKKVAIIGTRGLPARYGGFETLTHYLTEYLNDEFEFIVYCSRTPRNKRLHTFNNAKLKYLPFKANGWQSIIYDSISVLHAFFYSDHLIVLGFSGAFAFPLNKIFRKNIIYNIGGIEGKKVRGHIVLVKFEMFLKKVMEKLCVNNSNTVIIDNETFKEYIENAYGLAPVVAEYGGNHAIATLATAELKERYTFLNRAYDLTVSRAQEDMNIHLVIEAYKSLTNRTVVIISNWHISEYGKKLYTEYLNKYPNIILLTAIYEQTLLNAIRGGCEIYLHTHSLCGTAPSLVEAMSLELPVVSYDVPTNRATTEGKALYFSDSSSLIEILKSINKTELNRIKNDMAEISKRRYTWERVSSIYRECIL
jgi:glycosyltransferase involved in cell wall biosynthesis